MRIKSVHIEGFRCIQNLSLTFEPGLTTMVGENGTGKSTIGLAVRRLLGGQVPDEDSPHGRQVPTIIRAVLMFDSAELEEQLIARLVPSAIHESCLQQWLLSQGSEIELKYTRTREGAVSLELRWGSLRLNHSKLWLGEGNVSVGGETWESLTQPFESEKLSLPAWEARISGRQVDMPPLLSQVLSFIAGQRYKLVEEFRSRSATGGRSGAVESMSGSETASVLLNLKNHRDRQERARYSLIVETLKTFFPHYDIEAVEQQPGNAVPMIQFHQEGFEQPLSLGQLSAGVQEMLTLLANLIGRQGMVVFLEHPESHLHPHAMRSLNALLVTAAQRNQIIVVTHSPHFVHPKAPNTLRRVWWTPEEGTKVRAVDPATKDRQFAQMETALRQLGNREVVFARAVLLVEDESIRGFVCSLAAGSLGLDLDANSVSVVAVDGHDGFSPFMTLLDALGIPFVALRDKPWGNDTQFSEDRFFSLGAELEDFLDKSGLATIRAEVAKEIGTSKPRVAAALGGKLSQDQVPDKFKRVLEAVTTLATGRPQ